MASEIPRRGAFCSLSNLTRALILIALHVTLCGARNSTLSLNSLNPNPTPYPSAAENAMASTMVLQRYPVTLPRLDNMSLFASLKPHLSGDETAFFEANMPTWTKENEPGTYDRLISTLDQPFSYLGKIIVRMALINLIMANPVLPLKDRRRKKDKGGWYPLFALLNLWGSLYADSNQSGILKQFRPELSCQAALPELRKVTAAWLQDVSQMVDQHLVALENDDTDALQGLPSSQHLFEESQDGMTTLSALYMYEGMCHNSNAETAKWGVAAKQSIKSFYYAPDAHHNYGAFLSQTGQHSEALKHFKVIVHELPEYRTGSGEALDAFWKDYCSVNFLIFRAASDADEQQGMTCTSPESAQRQSVGYLHRMWDIQQCESFIKERVGSWHVSCGFVLSGFSLLVAHMTSPQSVEKSSMENSMLSYLSTATPEAVQGQAKAERLTVTEAYDILKACVDVLKMSPATHQRLSPRVETDLLPGLLRHHMGQRPRAVGGMHSERDAVDQSLPGMGPVVRPSPEWTVEQLVQNTNHPSESEVSITVIITAYRRYRTLKRQLRALRDQSVRVTTIWVAIFNSPEEAEFRKIEAELDAPDVKFIYGHIDSPKFYGWFGRFQLALHVDTEYVMIVDDDMIMGRRFIELCFRAHQTPIYKGLLGAAGWILPPERSNQHNKNFRSLRSYANGEWVQYERKLITQVDAICALTFMRADWAKLMFRERALSMDTADDLQFAYLVQKYANVPAFVLPGIHSKNVPDEFKGYSLDYGIISFANETTNVVSGMNSERDRVLWHTFSRGMKVLWPTSAPTVLEIPRVLFFADSTVHAHQLAMPYSSARYQLDAPGARTMVAVTGRPIDGFRRDEVALAMGVSLKDHDQRLVELFDLNVGFDFARNERDIDVISDVMFGLDGLLRSFCPHVMVFVHDSSPATTAAVLAAHSAGTRLVSIRPTPPYHMNSNLGLSLRHPSVWREDAIDAIVESFATEPVCTHADTRTLKDVIARTVRDPRSRALVSEDVVLGG